MTFWAALLGLIWDQIVPLHRPAQFERLFERYAAWIRTRVAAETFAHGFVAWAAAVLVPALLLGGLGSWLEDIAWPLGLAWSAAVLYRCLGYRQIVERARTLSDALAAEDAVRIGEALAGLDVAPDNDPVAPAAAARLFHHGLERLFGVLFWFALLGVFGAVMFASTQVLRKDWTGDDAFHYAVSRVVYGLDWLPARLLAFSFAIVGDFEHAMQAWRAESECDEAARPDLIRAAGLGALNLDHDRPADECLTGAIALLNRATLLWLGVAGLLWLGSY